MKKKVRIYKCGGGVKNMQDGGVPSAPIAPYYNSPSGFTPQNFKSKDDEWQALMDERNNIAFRLQAQNQNQTYYNENMNDMRKMDSMMLRIDPARSNAYQKQMAAQQQSVSFADGGANKTQDSQLDDIPQKRVNNFTKWLQDSTEKGIIREQEKQWDEYLKLMNKNVNPIAIEAFQNGGGPSSPGASYDDLTKQDTHLAFYQNQYNKDQESTDEMKGYLRGFGSNLAGIMSQPDVYKMKPGTVNPFGDEFNKEGYLSPEMTGMEITGIEPGKNKRHHTMKYNATGIQRFITPEMEQEQYNQLPWNNSNLTDEQYEAAMLSGQYQDGGLIYAQDGFDTSASACPAGYQKDYKGDCINITTGQPYIGAKTNLKSQGLENPFSQQQTNPLSSQQPMGFNATGQEYSNPGLSYGSIGETPDLMSGMDQQIETQSEIDLKKQSKLKTFDENNPYVKGEAIPNALNAIAWFGESDERAQAEADLRKRMSDPFMFNKTLGSDRGDYMANVPGFGHEFRPDEHTRWGMDTKVAQDGMEIDEELEYDMDDEFSVGSEQDLTEEEIQRLLAQGYKLEYID